MKGTVESFEEFAYLPGWWLMTMGDGKTYLVHNNWVIDNGVPEKGEEVEYELSEKPLYSDVRHGFLWWLKRVSVVEEDVSKAYEQPE